MDLIVRAKKKSDGEWVKGYIWRGSSVAVIIPYNIGVDVDTKKNALNAWAVEVDPATISRYTGREDSKGHFLVEHQIVEAQTCDGKVRGVLMYNESRGAWEVQVIHKGTDIQEVYDLISCVNIVALGNIFDNANLLDEVSSDVNDNEETKEKDNQKSDNEDSMKHEAPYVAPCGNTMDGGTFTCESICDVVGLREFMRLHPGYGVIIVGRSHR